MVADVLGITLVLWLRLGQGCAVTSVSVLMTQSWTRSLSVHRGSFVLHATEMMFILLTYLSNFLALSLCAELQFYIKPVTIYLYTQWSVTLMLQPAGL